MHARTPYYTILLPAMVRTALATGNPELAERLVIGVEAAHPVSRARARRRRGYALAKSAAISRVPSRATRTPPHDGGRSGSLPSRHSPSSVRAAPPRARPHRGGDRVARAARELFVRLEAAPALAETDALLQQATALSG